MDDWSDWQEERKDAPYADWILRVDNGWFAGETADRLVLEEFLRRLFRYDDAEPAETGIAAAVEAEVGHLVPIPSFARNNEKFKPGTPPAEALPALDDDAVIVGILDTGIALGHCRFRDADGGSRILAAWQQNAPWETDDRAGQPYLRFGHELYKRDIDSLIERHSVGGMGGWLDEEAFNRAVGAVDMRTVLGHRELEGRYAHGTECLDLAAGLDPATDDPDLLRRLKIIAVNLPTCPSFGFSGEFLDYYMINALERITGLADAIWDRKHPNAALGDPRGYPVVINASFGRQAGAKDLHDIFTRTLAALTKDRAERNRSPVGVVMPAGNDNLLRCNAMMTLGPAGDSEAEDTLDWRILPEDQTSNYVEIWPESGVRPEEIELSLTPPGGPVADPVPAQAGRVRRLGDMTAVYCDKVGSPEDQRVRLLLCVAPTLQQTGGPVAPAGLWRIRVRNRLGRPIEVLIGIQTDQSTLPRSRTGLRSYFDASDYRRYDGQGRVIDSYFYPGRGEDASRDKARLVRRHGTINASASNEIAARLAGYRLTDGRPAPYSATGLGRRRGPGSTGAPTAAFATEDGPAHFGILAAGARSGSAVAVRGTSFASALATRVIALDRMARPAWNESGRQRLYRMAEAGEQAWCSESCEADVEKVGGGRIPGPRSRAVSRKGQ